MAGKDYQSLQQQLDQILEELQAGDADIDKSLKLYKQGQAVVKELEVKLKAAKNELKTLSKDT